MSEELVQVLASFHREVVLPDMERVVQESERRLRNEMHGLTDGLAARMKHLETELGTALSGLKRVEERLDRVEQRLDGIEARLHDVEARLHDVEARLHDVEGRLHHVEGRLDDVEGRLGSIEEALQRAVLRSELNTQKSRVTALQKRIQDTLAKKILTGEIHDGDTVTVEKGSGDDYEFKVH